MKSSMRRNVKKILLALFVAFCVILICASIALFLSIRTGAIRSLIERRVSKATGMKVHMKSLHLLWPFGVEAETLSVASSVYETKPLLVCPKLRIKTSLGALLRRNLVSVELLGPKITVGKDELAGLKVSDIMGGAEGRHTLSVGMIKVAKGEVGLDLPGAKGSVNGIFLTLGKPVIPSGGEKVLTLNVNAANLSVGGQNQKQTPILLSSVESKFSLLTSAQSTEISGDIFAYVTTELPGLLLPPNIPISLSWATDYFPQKNSLENGIFTIKIPLYSDVRVYGSVANVLSPDPSPELKFSFAIPEVAETLQYNEILQRPQLKGLTLAGTVRVNGEMEGTFSKPELSLNASTEGARFEWKSLTLDGLNMNLPVSIGPGGFAIRPAQLNAEKASVPVSAGRIKASQLAVLFTADTSRLSVDKFEAQVGNSGRLNAEGNYEFASGRFVARASMNDGSVKEAVGLVPAEIYRLPEGLTMGGSFDFDCNLNGKVAPALENLTAKFDLTLRKGEFSSGESVSAGGIRANFKGDITGNSPKKIWNFRVDGSAGNFEVLVDTFYKAFPNSAFPLSFSGQYSTDAKRLQNADISLNLGSMGKVSAHGAARFGGKPEIETRLRADEIDVAQVFKEVGQQVLATISPTFQEASIGGIASTDIEVQVTDNHWKADGKLDIADGRVRLGDNAFAVDPVSVQLPFNIHSPQGVQGEPGSFESRDYGKIELGNLAVGPARIPSLSLDVAVKDNALHVKGPLPIKLFGGLLTLGEIRGKNLLSRSAELATSLKARDIYMIPVFEAMDFPKIPGSLNAEYPAITITGDSVTTRGSARMDVFGGALTIDSAGIEQPFSPVRTFRADLDFKHIDLSAFTSVFKFGSISGIMDGTLKDLEIAHGQPAALIADFDTVRESGVPQKISFDAVENISILGTGHGLQASLGRGFFSFFSELGYDEIGFRCTLKNDNFQIQGKAVEDTTEYLVKGVAFGPSINVINRNPGQTVSWKSMLERISRIQQKEQANE